MRQIINYLNAKNLYPDSLLELDWEPGLLCVDNDNGNYWVTVTDWRTDIRLIFNAIGLDYESKPNLSKLLKATKDEGFEWGVTVNSKNGLYSMYIEPKPGEMAAAAANNAWMEEDEIISDDNIRKDSVLKEWFPIRNIETTRTRMLFDNTTEWLESFVSVGFYYDANTDTFLTYKQYYDVPEKGIIHVYKKRPNQPTQFIIESSVTNMTQFRDDIGIKKIVGPDLHATSTSRSGISGNESYLMLATDKYAKGVI